MCDIKGNDPSKHFTVNKLVAVSAFTMLCSRHHYLAAECFHHKGGPITISHHSLSPLPARTWQSLLSFLSLWVYSPRGWYRVQVGTCSDLHYRKRTEHGLRNEMILGQVRQLVVQVSSDVGS